MTRGRTFFFMLLTLLISAMPGSESQAGQLRLECPEVIGIGLPFVVRVESDEPLDRLRVEWAGKKLDVPGAGKTAVQFLLGTDVLKSRPGTESLRILKLGLSPLAVQTSILVESRDFPEQRLSVPKEMASPPPEVQERIARENAEVRAVLGAVSPDNHLTLPLMRPVPGDVSSAYGLKRFFNDLERNPHRGLDLRAELGEPVRSAAPGQIVLAANHYYGGNSVFIDHGLGVFSVYMHLDEIKVRQGDMIEAGEIIGLAGQTGRVTGPHLHLGLYVLDLAVDPSALFSRTKANSKRRDMAKTQVSFEKRLERVREITALLEGGDLPLEQGVKLFQEGVRLSRECAAELEQARIVVESAGQDSSALPASQTGDEA